MIKLKQILIEGMSKNSIQDIIDSGAIDLLPSVLKTPVAPYFRMRALSMLWPVGVEKINQISLLLTDLTS